ncbi:Maf family nucleotide pyrophosphatase [Flavobacteriales bacterium]|nr:Maf family nucleotide pyrophosphatase [Flavobacteriales bacterium]
MKYQIILASKSPRRQELLKGLGFEFEIKTKEIEEVFPPALFKEEIPVYLSNLKAKAFKDYIKEDELVITSDTIVWNENKQLGKPKSRAEAIEMLQSLSGKQHEVITAVTLMTTIKTHSFYEITKVFFKELTLDEIEYYIDNYQPFDKAGSYGIQEWIGFVGIPKIEGDYFNVVGLPLNRLNEELKRF